MMSIIVSKFGGSSMADAAMFRRVNDIIQKKKHPHYIILSAPGKRCAGDEKITDLLCHAHSLFSSGKDPKDVISKIRRRFSEIIAALKLDSDPDSLMVPLENDIRCSRDRAASRGEYLCARIFAEYTSLPFVDAAELIYFDQDGRLQHEKTRSAIRKMAARLPCAVIPGFYGSLPSGEIKTFTRGGSDISGALIAAALHADIYENWTDVDGLMSIDPHICPDAIHHPAVSYRQMRKLARAGAHVLHPYCLEPVREAGVPTELKNTFFPERCGTYISDCVHRNVPCVCLRRGMRAIALDTLDSAAREIILSLHPEIYLSGYGREYIVPQSESAPGKNADMISIFSLPGNLRENALDIAKPLCYRMQEGCLTMLTERPADHDILSRLHALLLQKPQGVQNSRNA